MCMCMPGVYASTHLHVLLRTHSRASARRITAGFYGKMNGLWGLNGKGGDKLDFVLVEHDAQQHQQRPRRWQRDAVQRGGDGDGGADGGNRRVSRRDVFPNPYVPKKQQCSAAVPCADDGTYHCCADPACNLQRTCSSNAGLLSCACPTDASTVLPPATPPPSPTPTDAHVPDATDGSLRQRAMCAADGLWYACGDSDCTGYRSCRTDSSRFGCACEANITASSNTRGGNTAAGEGEGAGVGGGGGARGRPVNAVIVAEFGDGLWPGGYKGSEHIEVPNAVPDDDDDDGCSSTFCSQYSLMEAPAYNDRTIPAWMACNADLPSWTTHNQAISIDYDGSTVTIWYEGPLTKEGDFGGSSAGTHCHKDWMFDDGVRRRVFLQVGYTIDPAKDVVDRLYRVRNPAPNPTFAPPMGFIGGWVLTRWPEPHPLKKLHRFVHTGPDARRIQWRKPPAEEWVDLAGTEWQALPDTVPDDDVVVGWAGQPMSLSVTDSFVQGRSFTNSNHGEADNDDTGVCLCIAHNGVEMGGGLMHTAFSGTLGPVALRRLSLHLDLGAGAGAGAGVGAGAGSVENEGCQLSCPTRDQVIAEPQNTRGSVWDNPACDSGCTVSPCGTSVPADGNVPCCVKALPEPTLSRSCATRSVVSVCCCHVLSVVSAQCNAALRCSSYGFGPSVPWLSPQPV